ncbi:G2/M phase-specific E3 ubiquitin-protein ligase-like isoform X1 [Haliotis rubra]|uniref:G2/M phase-specific E3 ubiquitin-protein ligase-like isoform X1 n=2 Tax=Haliotis rubra TaxID=36100 RepID=UPI001EE5607F|nr:G2/M phase-specific E3 ubiquitin-protein ligase-like isoform X1 [Haliotis rubra]
MDHEYRDQVVKLSQAEDYTAFEDLIQMAGCISMVHTLSRRQEMCKAITKFIVFGRAHQGFDQFCRGLETLGVLGALKHHGTRMKEVFEYEKRLLDSTTIELLFEADLAKANSNRRRQEEIVLSNWRDFLLDLEEGTEVPTLKDLLVFVTGADGIPPLGFDPLSTPAVSLGRN